MTLAIKHLTRRVPATPDQYCVRYQTFDKNFAVSFLVGRGPAGAMALLRPGEHLCLETPRVNQGQSRREGFVTFLAPRIRILRTHKLCIHCLRNPSNAPESVYPSGKTTEIRCLVSRWREDRPVVLRFWYSEEDNRIAPAENPFLPKALPMCPERT